MTRATFGAGCFWGIEYFFRQCDGVNDVKVGYGGGHTNSPTYHDVCYDNTGHAELVDITFNPDIIRYEALLKQFWVCHDPTQLNRQGVDIGDQYRSVIFTHSDEQHNIAEQSKHEHQAQYHHNIVTIITPFVSFYPAEDYHQRYIEKKRGLI